MSKVIADHCIGSGKITTTITSLESSLIMILYCIARASLNSCLFKLRPVSLSGSSVNQFEAPGFWHMSIFFISFSIRSSRLSIDLSCSFCCISLYFCNVFLYFFHLISFNIPKPILIYNNLGKRFISLMEFSYSSFAISAGLVTTIPHSFGGSAINCLITFFTLYPKSEGPKSLEMLLMFGIVLI